ncbi:MAG TPA: phosphonate C-P lyase system protein PhnH [Noviherbaspirillum sp.]|jgi:alpha-D-ribose 1-methylphosphonate 5-triphosphate synthase subunit PhnH|uniref:phosphonate C-P lyase system protein PhnH n=1 Tax=Noviherbaspirillum sp. TaxID=1926288 RepID=UPI002DDD7BD6|nr:phosphonate C-P lyase system protein PhnH [Noviherbaspirillum sp.]HEV2612954.1 phosphonate C-P lyase system protein PhnH [Noviherbaspirillum sp.]
MSALADDLLLAAWTDGVHASQATFRCVLNALAEPGLRQTVPVRIEGPAPLDPATTALCLALMDFETPVWRDASANTPAVTSYLRFHCGSPLVGDRSQASFAIVAVPTPLMFSGFTQGTMEYPDRSCTLIIQLPSLDGGPPRTLSGPGIENTRTLSVDGLPDDFDLQWRENNAAFPLGVDVIFCCGDEIIGLPRTTRVQS